MRMLVSLGLLLAAMPATASQPAGATYGGWHVVSISSLSGTEANDASVLLTQGDEPNILQVEWTMGSPIIVSISIARCTDDKSFEVSRTVDIRKWLRMSRGQIQQRLRSDMIAWLRQASLACGSTDPAAMFDMSRFDAASTDFDDRLRYFAGHNDIRGFRTKHQ